MFSTCVRNLWIKLHNHLPAGQFCEIKMQPEFAMLSREGVNCWIFACVQKDHVFGELSGPFIAYNDFVTGIAGILYARQINMVAGLIKPYCNLMNVAVAADVHNLACRISLPCVCC